MGIFSIKAIMTGSMAMQIQRIFQSPGLATLSLHIVVHLEEDLFPVSLGASRKFSLSRQKGGLINSVLAPVLAPVIDSPNPFVLMHGSRRRGFIDLTRGRPGISQMT